VNSCTDALCFALLAAGIGQGDEVLVTDFSFIASGSCIPLTGATPVFVDIDETYNTNLDLAEARVTKKTRAIIFVHLYGQMGDPAKIEAFARAHNLILIEDAAQAIGATFNGRKAGSLGQVSCLSFNSTKTVSAPGGGGMVLTDDDVLAEGIRRQRYHGRASGGQFAVLGHNSLMPTLTAAVLNSKLDHDAEWLARRRQIARHYRERLADIDAGLMLPIESAGAIHNYHKFVVCSPRRDALRVHLEQRGIEAKVHYPLPLHREPCFASYGYRDEEYPNAVRSAETVVTLPSHAYLTDSEVETIVGAIREFHPR
jgi:dTDP-4-amino-4,6-dideoxygalactose transaminase